MTDLVKGITVYDESSDRYGTIADTTTSPGLVYLRPLGGGLEWRVPRECIRPALASEMLAMRLPAAGRGLL